MPFFLLHTDHGKFDTEYRGDAKLSLGMIVLDFIDRQYSHKGTLGLLKVYKVTPEYGLCEDITAEVAREAWHTIDANNGDCSGNELRLLKEHNLVPDHVERIEGGLWIYEGAPAERSLAAEHSLSAIQLGVGGRR